MRPLKRPMFRTGGPIGEGIMHGMNGLQNGGTVRHMNGLANGGMPNNQGPRRAALVGNPIYPVGPDGRTGHNLAFRIGGGLLNYAKPFLKPGNYKSGLKNFYQGFRTPTSPPKSNFFSWDTLKNLRPTQRFRKTTNVPGQGNVLTEAQIKAGMRGTPGNVPWKEVFSTPKLWGQAIRENPWWTAAAAGQIKNADHIGGGIYKGGKWGLQQGVNYLLGTEFGKKKPLIVTPKKGDGTRGSLFGKDGATKVLSAAEKEAKDKERLNKIYSLLGVDRAKKNAASKALIDVSRYIDEGGKDTVSKKNIGSTISKAIGAFDKRLDKVDQLKEAAGLMIAKDYLEGGDKALDRRYKQSRIDLADKELNPKYSTIKASFKKTLSGDDLITASATEAFGDSFGGILMSTKKFNKAMKAAEGTAIEEDAILQIATNELQEIEKRDGEGKISAGYYAVGDKIVRINQEGVADKVVG